MFERFTERARHVVVVAQEEARALHHNYIGTEHILLGLLHDHGTAAGEALAALGLTLDSVRDRVAQICQPSDELTAGQIPFTPRAKKVLELALREALALSHNYIGTEHVLLGLVREGEGVAMRVLLESDATPEKVRTEILRRLPESADKFVPETAPGGHAATVDMVQDLRVSHLTVTVTPDTELRRLLVAAAGRALTDERNEFGLADLLAAADLKPDGS